MVSTTRKPVCPAVTLDVPRFRRMRKRPKALGPLIADSLYRPLKMSSQHAFVYSREAYIKGALYIKFFRPVGLGFPGTNCFSWHLPVKGIICSSTQMFGEHGSVRQAFLIMSRRGRTFHSRSASLSSSETAGHTNAHAHAHTQHNTTHTRTQHTQHTTHPHTKNCLFPWFFDNLVPVCNNILHV